MALGFPSRTDVTGLLSKMLNNLFIRAEQFLNRRWPHKFYHYKLTDNVKHACQALAIDDERTAFWPHIWREQEREEGSVEQVWFAGMHSNVGGGYERSGLASVALNWMMVRAEKCGIRFEDGELQRARHDSHVHGRMYNSRDGAGIFYRYHPREIESLCEGRIKGEIRLHRSVIERINYRTANYAPGQLPGRFAVVDDEPDSAIELRNPGSHTDWKHYRGVIDHWVHQRKCLYETMLKFLLGFLAAGLGAWWLVDKPASRDGVSGYIADLLDYVVPGFLEPLIHWMVCEQPWVLLILLFAGVFYFRRMKEYRTNTVRACEKLRHLVIEETKDENKAGEQAS